MPRAPRSVSVQNMNMPWTRRSAAAVVAALALSFTACAGSRAETTAAVEPATYVRSVCRALVEWDEGIESAWGRSQALSTWAGPAAIRSEMVTFFDDLEETTDALHGRVTKAGFPAVSDGEATAGALREALATASGKLTSNRIEFAAIPLSDVQPAASIEGALTVVGEQLEAVEDSLELLEGRNAELARATGSEPECIRFRDQK